MRDRRTTNVYLPFLLALTVALPGLDSPSPAAPRRPPRPRPPVGDPLRPGVWRLHGTDPAQSTSDLAPLKTLIGRATVVGLGESIHTSGGFHRVKDRVIRYLVSDLGFRVLALETPWIGADQLAAYVESCVGRPEGPMTTTFGVWQSEETRDLFTWICEWNLAHPDPQDRVHFMGFDIQDVYGQIPADAAELRTFLSQIGIDAADPRSANLDRCEGVARSENSIPPEHHSACAAALDAIDEIFIARASELARLTSPTDLGWAKLHLDAIRAWEELVYNATFNAPQSRTARDAGMASTLLGLRALRYPNAKTIVWAHNSHLSEGNTTETFRGAQAMGSFLAAALGKDYLTVALSSQNTEIDWRGVGCGTRAGIGTPGSIEAILHDLGAGDLIVDLNQAGIVPGLIPAGLQKLGGSKLLIDRDFDLLLYLDHSPPMHPLQWSPCS